MRHAGSGEHHHRNTWPELDTLGSSQISPQTGQHQDHSIELITFLQMTLEVAAGYEECFFVDNVKTGQSIDFEFQVGLIFHHRYKILNVTKHA